MESARVVINGVIGSFLMLIGSAIGTTVWAKPVLLVVGDSLSAAYNIPIEEGWVMRLQTMLNEKGYDVEVHNASISGDTSQNAKSRLAPLLETLKPRYVILELGGNDGLRGFATSKLEANLSTMITMCRAYTPHILLLGIQIPPNYGPAYTKAFAAVYPTLAKRHGILLMPFLLEDIALHPELMQQDRIHPTAEAQIIILNQVFPYAVQLISAYPGE